jgi:ABC-type nitrate/sulfonate/bicarbonate transport system permease component
LFPPHGLGHPAIEAADARAPGGAWPLPAAAAQRRVATEALLVFLRLVVVWFGFGLMPKVILIVLVTFFPLTVALVEGYAATNATSEALFRSFGAGWWQTFRRLRLPTALPFFFAGLRIAITYAVVGAVFAEYAGSEQGLGIYMQNAKNSFRTDLVLAAVMVIATITLTLFAVTYLLERWAMPWARGRKAGGVTA